MASKPKSTSLLEQAKSLAAKNVDWLEALPKDKQVEVHELLQAKASGMIRASKEDIVRLLSANGIKTSVTSLRRALSKYCETPNETR